MIAFKYDTELEIVESFDEANDTIASQSVETFRAGEPVDADIVSENGEFVDLQFGGGGGLALGVQRASFTILADADIEFERAERKATEEAQWERDQKRCSD